MPVTDFDRYVCGTAQSGAAQGLLALMCGISEDCYCAGWMMGLEDALWNVQPGTRYGQGTITERQTTLLRLLAEEAGGWWRWSDNGPVFVKS